MEEVYNAEDGEEAIDSESENQGRLPVGGDLEAVR